MMKKLVAVLCLGFTACAQAAEGIETKAFFASTLVGVDGRAVPMEQFRGRPLVVNFWARWCGPCREEIPELVRLQGEQAVDGIEVIGVALEDDAGRVRDFARAYDMSYPVVLAARDGIALMKTLGNDKAGLPFTVYIGRDGSPVGSKLGVVRRADLDAAVETLLQ